MIAEERINIEIIIFIVSIAFILLGLSVMMYLNNKEKRCITAMNKTMNEFIYNHLPHLQGTQFDVINLLDDLLNTQYFWMVAYHNEGMYFIPTKLDPLDQTLALYKNLTHSLELRKQFSVNLFSEHKVEWLLYYIPFSVITNVVIAEGRKRIKIQIGDMELSLKYQYKNCFGINQEEGVSKLLDCLSGIER